MNPLFMSLIFSIFEYQNEDLRSNFSRFQRAFLCSVVYHYFLIPVFMDEKTNELLRLLNKTLNDLTEEVAELRRGNQKQVIYSNIQAAELLGITTATLKKWRELGLISFSRVDNTYLYTPDDIKDFLKRTHFATRANKKTINKLLDSLQI